MRGLRGGALRCGRLHHGICGRAPGLAACILLMARVTVEATTNGFPNSLGQTPPMGWRSWNAFEESVTQERITAQVDAIAMRRHPPPTAPRAPAVSLLDLGYARVGLDDGYQACGAGVNGTFHGPDGQLLIDMKKFPDMRAMTAHAHGLNVSMDFYLNNCGCSEKGHPPHYAQDVEFLVQTGWDGTKIDGCGPAPNVTLWATLMNATGRQLMLANCNDGFSRPTHDSCPFNTFRTTNDIAPQFESAMSNLQGNLPWLAYSKPGCWSMPDMLEAFTVWPQGGRCDPCTGTPMSFAESRTHFGAWCVSSAPLILGFDLSNTSTYDAAWPVVANTEAIAVNQAWYGSPGFVAAQSAHNFTTLVYHGAGRDLQDNETLPVWQGWVKPLAKGKVAAMIINLGPAALGAEAGMAISFAAAGLAPHATARVRDLWTHRDAGQVTGTWGVPALAPHDSAFVVLDTTVHMSGGEA